LGKPVSELGAPTRGTDRQRDDHVRLRPVEDVMPSGPTAGDLDGPAALAHRDDDRPYATGGPLRVDVAEPPAAAAGVPVLRRQLDEAAVALAGCARDAQRRAGERRV